MEAVIEPVKNTSKRGRPKKVDALSAAERAKRYRDKQRALKAARLHEKPIETKSTVTPVDINQQALLQEVETLRKRLAETERIKHDLIGALDVFVDAKRKRQKIPAQVFTQLCGFLALVK